MADGDDYKTYQLGAQIRKDDISAQQNLAYVRANLEARESLTDVAIQGLALWVKARKAKLRRGAK